MSTHKGQGSGKAGVGVVSGRSWSSLRRTEGRGFQVTGWAFQGVIQPWKKSYDQPAAAAESLQSCLTLRPPRRQPTRHPPSLGFSRKEHLSGLPFPSPMHESEKGK